MEDGFNWGIVCWPIAILVVVLLVWAILSSIKNPTFSTTFFCRNCRAVFKKWYEKGTEVERDRWHEKTLVKRPGQTRYKVECPKCGSKKVV